MNRHHQYSLPLLVVSVCIVDLCVDQSLHRVLNRNPAIYRRQFEYASLIRQHCALVVIPVCPLSSYEYLRYRENGNSKRRFGRKRTRSLRVESRVLAVGVIKGDSG